MSPYPTPAREGHWWAKLEAHESRDLLSVDWEVVQVFDNNGPPGDIEEFMVSVPGIEGGQRLGAFVWGPPVHRPAELEDQ